jgi:hypothetical protein
MRSNAAHLKEKLSNQEMRGNAAHLKEKLSKVLNQEMRRNAAHLREKPLKAPCQAQLENLLSRLLEKGYLEGLKKVKKILIETQ